MKGFLVVLFVFLAILLVAAACGGGSGGSTVSTGNSYAPNQSAPKANTGQGSVTAPQPGDQSTGPSTTIPNNVPTLAGPPVIRQAQLNISVGSGTFGSKLSEVRSLVEDAGGYIAGTDAQATPVNDSSQPTQLRTGIINFMVPAANFDRTIDQLSKVGTVEGEHITGTDVSAQYVDLNARLDNAEAQHQVYLALLAKATNTNDIIALENQIGQITAQIEQLKGQIKYLDNNTSYSAITVTMTESGPAPQAQSSDNWGFATALNNAAHNFVATINYVVSGLGALGPLLVLAFAGYLVWRRRRAPQPKHA